MGFLVTALTTIFWFVFGWEANNLSRRRRAGSTDDEGGDR